MKDYRTFATFGHSFLRTYGEQFGYEVDYRSSITERWSEKHGKHASFTLNKFDWLVVELRYNHEFGEAPHAFYKPAGSSKHEEWCDGKYRTLQLVREHHLPYVEPAPPPPCSTCDNGFVLIARAPPPIPRIAPPRPPAEESVEEEFVEWL